MYGKVMSAKEKKKRKKNSKCLCCSSAEERAESAAAVSEHSHSLAAAAPHLHHHQHQHLSMGKAVSFHRQADMHAGGLGETLEEISWTKWQAGRSNSSWTRAERTSRTHSEEAASDLATWLRSGALKDSVRQAWWSSIASCFIFRLLWTLLSLASTCSTRILIFYLRTQRKAAATRQSFQGKKLQKGVNKLINELW